MDVRGAWLLMRTFGILKPLGMYMQARKLATGDDELDRQIEERYGIPDGTPQEQYAHALRVFGLPRDWRYSDSGLRQAARAAAHGRSGVELLRPIQAFGAIYDYAHPEPDE